MHELGIARNIVDIARNCAKKNNAQKVLKVVVEVGSLSGVMPESLEFCFSICTKDTILEGARLEIHKVASLAICHECKKAFDLTRHNFSCPVCDGKYWEIQSGKELIVKELGVI